MRAQDLLIMVIVSNVGLGCTTSVVQPVEEFEESEPSIVVFSDEANGSHDSAPVEGTIGDIDPEHVAEIWRWREMEYGPPVFESEPEPDLTAEAVAFAESLRPGTVVRVTARLQTRAVYTALHEAVSQEEHETAVEQIRVQFAPEQASFTDDMKARHDARNFSHHWLANLVGFNATAEEAQTIAEHASVHTLYVAELRDTTRAELVPGDDGLELRQLTRGLQLNNEGYDGSTFGGRVGQIEAFLNVDGSPNYLRSSHDAFETSTGASRVQDVMDCTPNCTPQTTQPTGSGGHGTIVAWAALGSGVNAGSFTAQRTSINENGEFNYYRVNSCEAVISAMEHGVLNGVDIWNMSMTPDSTKSCSRTTDCQGLNVALRQGGQYVFKSAGNQGRASDDEGEQHCRLTYPAWHPRVVAVGALDNIDTFGNELPYDSMGVRDESSTGGVKIRFGPGYQARDDSVGLMGVGTLTQYANSNSSGSWAENTAAPGTSFAAPQATASYTLLVEALDDLIPVYNPTDESQNIANMLLMGDGARGRSGSSPEVVSGLSDLTSHRTQT